MIDKLHVFRLHAFGCVLLLVLNISCHRTEKDETRMMDDFSLGQFYLKQDSFENAIRYFQKAEERFKNSNDTYNQIKCLKILSDCYSSQGNWQQALKSIKNALLCADKSQIPTEPLYISLIRSNALILYYEGNYDSAYRLIKKAIELVPGSKSYSDSLNASLYQVMGSILYLNKEYIKASESFIKAISLHEINSNTDKEEITNCYLGAGLSLKRQGEISLCYKYLKKAFALQKLQKNYNPKTSCDLYLTFCSLLIELGFYGEGQLYLDTAEIILKKNNLNQTNEKRLILIKRGLISLKSGDYNKAFSYFTEVHRITSKLEQNIQFNDEINQYLGNCEFYRGNYNKALEFYNKSLNIKIKNESPGKSDLYNGMALCFKQLKINDSAHTFYLLAINNRLLENPIKYASLARDYLNTGSFYLSIDQNEIAFDYFLKALKRYKSVFGERHPDIANCLLFIAQYHQKTGNLLRSIEYCQKALIANSRKYNNMDYSTLPPLKDQFSDLVHLNILKFKAVALKEYYQLNKPKNLIPYIVSLDCYEQIAKIINNLSVSYQEQESQSFLAKNEKGTYVKGMLTALDLYSITSDIKYKQRAFTLAENSNAAVYRASISSHNAIHWQGIPDSIISLEHQYNSYLIASRVFLENAKNVTNPDTALIQHLEEKCFLFQDKQNGLISLIEKHYPEYYKIKYSMNSPEIGELRKRLIPGQAIVKYVIHDSLLVSFVLNKNTFIIIKHIINKEHLTDLDYYLNQLRKYSPGTLLPDHYYKFLQTSYRLYTILVKPVLDLTSCKKLIIIPDEKLALLPFESLLTQDISQISTFKQLPYLIRLISIGYGINSYHAVSLVKKDKDENLGSLLAFAPFSNTELSNPHSLSTSSVNSIKLSNLPYATEEAENIVSDYGGNSLIGKNATKKAFIERASHYNILHLATHAVADESGQEHSRLYFYPVNGKSADGILRADELPGIKLNAKMVVLSSCNSGSGQMVSGTGVLSMAHSFACAGCPSVVMSLWTSNDKSNSELMKYFYDGLKKGLTKSEALKEAKLKYLDSTDPLFAHPYYWSGVISLGNDEPIISKTFTGNLLIRIYFILCIASVILVFLLQKNHK